MSKEKQDEKQDGCIKFNRNSWHYKVTDYVFPYSLSRSYKKYSLCPYMRMVLVSVILYPFMQVWNRLPYKIREFAWIFQAELIFLFLVMIASFVIDYGDSTYETQSMPPFWDLVAYGFLGGNVIGIVGGLVLFGAYALVDYIKGRPKKTKAKREHKTTGLFKAYVHAKHNKICPCVEFIDEVKDEELK